MAALAPAHGLRLTHLQWVERRIRFVSKCKEKLNILISQCQTTARCVTCRNSSLFWGRGEGDILHKGLFLKNITGKPKALNANYLLLLIKSHHWQEMIFLGYLQDLHSCTAFHPHQCPVLGLDEYFRFLLAPGTCGCECRSTGPMARHGSASMEHRCTSHITQAVREGPGLCWNGPMGRACRWKT